MPITDPEASTQLPQHGAPVDNNAIANAVVQGIRASGMLTQQQPKPAEKDVLEEALSELGNDPESEPVKNWHRKIAEGVTKKVTESVTKQVMEQGVRDRQKRDTDIVRDLVHEAVKDDESLKGKEDKIMAAVVHEFTTGSEHEHARQNYNQDGDLNISLIKKIISSEVADRRPAQRPQAKSATGMNDRDGGADSAPSYEGNSLDPKSLKGRELELYNAKLTIAQKARMPAGSKEAAEFASAGVMSFRRGKEAARAKYGANYINGKE